MITLIYCTFPGAETAEKIAKSLVEQRLIACFNLFPMQSGYLWENAYCTENETVALLKTHPEKQAQVEAALLAVHPYQTPCIIHWSVSANAAYEQWIHEIVNTDQ
jgi:periplasmic divalent cation tolerance protein